MHDWTEGTPVYLLDQLCLGFNFVCAAGEGVKCLGGDRLGIKEIYLIEASAGVSFTSYGGVFIAQFDLAFAENSSEFAVS